MLSLSPFALLMILATVGVIVTHSIYLVAERRWMALDPLNTFWGGAIVIYLIQPLTYGGVFVAWHSETIFEETLLWCLLGMLAVAVGYELRIGVRACRFVPQTPYRLRIPGLLFLSLLFTGLGVIGYAYQISTGGGLTEWLSVSRGGTDWNNISVYVAQLADLLPLGISLLLVSVNLQREAMLRTSVAWILSALMLAWLFYLGSRSRTIGWVGLMIATYYLPRRKNPPVSLLAVGFLALFAASNFLGHYRGNFRGGSFNVDEFESAEIAQNAIPLFYDRDVEERKDVSRGIEFNCVMAVVEGTATGIPYNYGSGLLEMFTRPIPRALWPEKRYPSVEAVQDVLWASGLSHAKIRDTGLLMGPAFTFVGYWYYAFGPLGVFIAGIFTGVLMRLIRTIFDRRPGSHGDFVLFANLMFIGFSEAAATPLNFVYSLPYILVPLLILFYFAGEPQSRSTATAPLSTRSFDSTS